MPIFFCRLNPPRGAFASDMSEEEKALMQTHAAWWSNLTTQGEAVLFGPVFDPKAPWGLGIIEAEDEEKARALTEEDPVIKAARGFTYEVLPMQIGAVRGAKA
jgi:uncharacterized protein YciI